MAGVHRDEAALAWAVCREVLLRRCCQACVRCVCTPSSAFSGSSGCLARSWHWLLWCLGCETGETSVQVDRDNGCRLLPPGYLTGERVDICCLLTKHWGAETSQLHLLFFCAWVHEGSICSGSDLPASMRKGLFVQHLDVGAR